ncbi:MAG: hypothetical protein DMG54_26920 [Acidobacteria bacterium]|nr:MAG: hypothetical protein DMG54_26920 [Acidobacteriota bacterium]
METEFRPPRAPHGLRGKFRRIHASYFRPAFQLQRICRSGFCDALRSSQDHAPSEPGGFGIAEGRLNTPAHGIGVAPDGKSLWVNSTLANAVFEYSLPDLALVGHTSLPLVYPLGHVPTGSVPEWITFTPDSRLVYISNSGNRLVSAIDTKTLKLVAVIPVGEVPKRIDTLVLH